ncbi:MAG: DNA replication/repair protein RecF [bacterium]
MYLQQLVLTNFKNYSEADLEFSTKINCFIGNNATGKTNILDAIYYLSFCKSYFNAVDNQNIRHEADFFAVHGTYLNQDSGSNKVSCVQRRGMKKSFKFNKKEYDRLADHIGKIPLVMISPYDRDLINEGSEVRRKYIDGVISQFDHLYLSDLIDYNKALLQRNTLLKQFAERRYFDEVSLQVWNEKINELGTRIFKARKKFLTDFNPLFEEFYRYLSDNGEKVEIIYESQLNISPLEQLLRESVDKDLAVKYTTTGIHKDDLVFMINGYPVKKFGSQGQQKTFVVAVKLAQFEFTRRTKGFRPILLFDDIFDKLDDNRVQQIIHLVNEDNFGQVFITDTQRQRIESIFKGVEIDHKIFHVSDNQVKDTTDS